MNESPFKPQMILIKCKESLHSIMNKIVFIITISVLISIISYLNESHFILTMMLVSVGIVIAVSMADSSSKDSNKTKSTPFPLSSPVSNYTEPFISSDQEIAKYTQMEHSLRFYINSNKESKDEKSIHGVKIAQIMLSAVSELKGFLCTYPMDSNVYSEMKAYHERNMNEAQREYEEGTKGLSISYKTVTTKGFGGKG